MMRRYRRKMTVSWAPGDYHARVVYPYAEGDGHQIIYTESLFDALSKIYEERFYRPAANGKVQAELGRRPDEPDLR